MLCRFQAFIPGNDHAVKYIDEHGLRLIDIACDDLAGKQVVVVANLAPRKMRGIESNGMILLAEDLDGKLKFVVPESIVSPGITVN